MVVIKGKKFPDWVQDAIPDIAFGRMTIREIAKKYNKSRNMVSKWKLDTIVASEIERLKNEIVDRYRDRLFDLADNAFKSLEDISVAADTDSTRLKAADKILTQIGILDKDSQKIELGGIIEIPNITITTNKVEEGVIDE